MGRLALTVVLLVGYAMLPGVVLGRASGLRGARLLAFAPPLSLAVIAFGSVVTTVVPLGWGLVTIVLATGFLTLVASGCRSVAQRAGAARSAAAFGHELPRHALILTASSLVLCSALWSWVLARVLPAPDSFSQTYDNVFHLSTIRFIYESGSASPLLPIGLGDGTPGRSFYPTLWHAFTALGMPMAGDVAIATNAALLVVCGIVWPASLLAFLFSMTRLRAATILATAAVAAGVSSFPLLTLTWGVLYPNTLGFALVPAAMGGILAASGMGVAGGSLRLPLALASAFIIPAVFLGHPNALILTILAIAPALVTAAWRYWRAPSPSRSHGTRFIVAAAQVLVSVALVACWLLVRPGFNAWPPIASKLPALGEGLLLTMPARSPNLAVAALVIVGLVWVLRARAHRWLAVSWAIVLALWVVVASFAEGQLRTLLTETFFSDPPRLAAALAVVAAPLALLGINSLLDRLDHNVGDSPSPWVAISPGAGRTAVLLPTVLLVVATQAMPGMTNAIERAQGAYEFAPAACVAGDVTCLTTADERALLRRLPHLIERGSVTLTLPTNGSSLAYALEGMPVAWTYISEQPRPAVLTLEQRLALVPAGDPDICAAAASLGIRYVLDFGKQNVSGDIEVHPGLEGLSRARSVERVDSVGDAVLYRLRGCPTS